MYIYIYMYIYTYTFRRRVKGKRPTSCILWLKDWVIQNCSKDSCMKTYPFQLAKVPDAEVTNGGKFANPD